MWMLIIHQNTVSEQTQVLEQQPDVVRSRWPGGSAGAACSAASSALGGMRALWEAVAAAGLEGPALGALCLCAAITAVVVAWLFRRGGRPVYLLNYAVFKPPDDWKISTAKFLDNSVRCGVRCTLLWPLRAVPSIRNPSQ